MKLFLIGSKYTRLAEIASELGKKYEVEPTCLDGMTGENAISLVESENGPVSEPSFILYGERAEGMRAAMAAANHIIIISGGRFSSIIRIISGKYKLCGIPTGRREALKERRAFFSSVNIHKLSIATEHFAYKRSVARSARAAKRLADKKK